MNRYILYVSFLATVAVSSISYAQQVTINITARVLEKTCTISSNTTNFSVQMNAADARRTTIGVAFGETPFSISLEECPMNVTTAHVKLTGDGDLTMPNLLKINTAGDTDANGIAIGLYDKSRNNIDVRNNLTDFTIDHVNNKTMLEFIAAYVKTSNNYSGGKVTSVASFEISYD